MGVLWIGTDVVDLDRFRLALRRTPGMVERVFTEGERAYALRKNDPTERLAARSGVVQRRPQCRGRPGREPGGGNPEDAFFVLDDSPNDTCFQAHFSCGVIIPTDL